MALSVDQLQRARSNFQFDDGLIFLNHASHSPLCQPARAVYDRYLDSWQTTAHQHDIESFKIIESVRVNLSEFVGCSAERIGLSSGTSFGLNIIAGGYPWKQGDNVVVSSDEFPAVVYPWRRLRSRGVETRLAASRDGFIDEDALIAASDNNTRVICVTWVQFNNGYRTDLKKLGDYCSENDILLCVDGIQGLGVIPIDLSKLNIDLFTCGCQKWMFGPCGTGFYYLSEKAESVIDDPVFGWLSVDWGVDFTDLCRYDLPPRKGPSRYEFSTYPFQDIRAFHAALEMLGSFDHDSRWGQIRFLTNMVFDYAESNKNISLASSREDSRRSGIVNISTGNSKELYAFIVDKNISVSYRQGGIRISPHFYNSPDEIEYLLSMISEFTG